MAKPTLEIRSLARAHTETAINTLAHIMRSSDAPPSARVAAAQGLLDRGWGKAEQTLKVERVRAPEMTDDELASIAVGGSEGADPAPIDPSQLN